jgi:hypothetical protein
MHAIASIYNLSVTSVAIYCCSSVAKMAKHDQRYETCRRRLYKFGNRTSLSVISAISEIQRFGSRVLICYWFRTVSSSGLWVSLVLHALHAAQEGHVCKLDAECTGAVQPRDLPVVCQDPTIRSTLTIIDQHDIARRPEDALRRPRMCLAHELDKALIQRPGLLRSHCWSKVLHQPCRVYSRFAFAIGPTH